jgi:hypothetical protein
MQEDPGKNEDMEDKFVLGADPPKDESDAENMSDTPAPQESAENVPVSTPQPVVNYDDTPKTMSDVVNPVPETPVLENPVSSPGDTEPSVSTQPIPPQESELAMPTPNEPIASPVGTDLNFATASPKKKSKKLIIFGIIAIIIAVLLGGSAYAFNTIYQSPQKVVTDAFIKAMSTPKALYTGDIKIKNDDIDITMTLATKYEGMDVGSLGMTVSATYQNKIYSMATDVLVDRDGDMFFKLSDIKDIIKEVKDQVGIESGSMLALAIDNFVNKVDGEWIKISKTDIEKYFGAKTSEQICVQGALNTLYADKSVMEEVTGVYESHPFIGIENELGQQGGSLGYQLNGNSNELKAFIIGLKDTSVYKAVYACDSSYAIDENDLDFDESAGASEDSDATIKLWADYWTHQLTKVEINAVSDGTTVDMTFVPDFSPTVTVDTPEKSITPDELEDYIVSIWMAFGYEGGQQEYLYNYDTMYKMQDIDVMDV